jgi:hypothetical protein
MIPLSIVHESESTGRRLLREFYPMRFLCIEHRDTSVPRSLDKKSGRKIPFMFHLYLIKDGTVFPPFLSNEPGTALWSKYAALHN